MDEGTWPNPSQRGIDMTQEEAMAFVGPRAHRYVHMWSEYVSGRSAWPRMNFAATLAGPFWLAYRKLYAPLGLWWTCVIVIALADLAVWQPRFRLDAALSNLVSGLVLGLIANYVYLWKAQRTVSRLRKTTPEPELDAALRRAGGASWIAMFAAMTVGYLGTVFVLVLFAWWFGSPVDYQP